MSLVALAKTKKNSKIKTEVTGAPTEPLSQAFNRLVATLYSLLRKYYFDMQVVAFVKLLRLYILK